MSNYAELVEELRLEANNMFYRPPDCELFAQAADAIEALQKLAQKLLANYQEEATGMVWEYSGDIEQSLDWLEQRCADFRAQIDGDDIYAKTHEVVKKSISMGKKI